MADNVGGSICSYNTVGVNHLESQKIESDVDSNGKIWSLYMLETDVYDKALVERWSESMNGLLIFAGLFSATVTSFIIESYKTLQEDPGLSTVALLTQISQQIAVMANGSQLSVSIPTLTQARFTPTSSAIRVNVFWFLSLCFALACALSATLVELWARHYLQAIQRRPKAYKRAQIRSYLHDGIITFKVTSVVATIPTLMHISLFLFFAGLAESMLPINTLLAHVSFGMLAACAFLYIVASVLPIVYHDCPYRTSLSGPIWQIFRVLRLLLYRANNDTIFKKSMSDTREDLAPQSFLKSQILDALHLTVTSLTDDLDLQPFAEGIPGFLSPGSKNDEETISAMVALVFRAASHLSCLSPNWQQIIFILETCNFRLH